MANIRCIFCWITYFTYIFIIKIGFAMWSIIIRTIFPYITISGNMSFPQATKTTFLFNQTLLAVLHTQNVCTRTRPMITITKITNILFICSYRKRSRLINFSNRLKFSLFIKFSYFWLLSPYELKDWELDCETWKCLVDWKTDSQN